MELQQIPYKDYFITEMKISLSKHEQENKLGSFWVVEDNNNTWFAPLKDKLFTSIAQAKKFITQLQNKTLMAYWQHKNNENTLMVVNKGKHNAEYFMKIIEEKNK